MSLCDNIRNLCAFYSIRFSIFVHFCVLYFLVDLSNEAFLLAIHALPFTFCQTGQVNYFTIINVFEFILMLHCCAYIYTSWKTFNTPPSTSLSIERMNVKSVMYANRIACTGCARGPHRNQCSANFSDKIFNREISIDRTATYGECIIN